MVLELRRRGVMLFDTDIDDWDLLIMAQHFGMKTRLLDWTSNPLTALWFACSNNDPNYSSFVYLLIYSDKDILDKNKFPSPFDITHTMVIHPTLNNQRIIAQHGLFTVHTYIKNHKKFVPLNKNSLLKDKLIMIEIPGKLKNDLIIKLNILGVNKFTLFPDIEGLCNYINWLKG